MMMAETVFIALGIIVGVMAVILLLFVALLAAGICDRKRKSAPYEMIGNINSMRKDVDELMEEKRRRYKIEDEYDRMKKYLNECALKFAHGSALLRDMKNEHDMSDDLRKQIDGLIRELDGFASDVNGFFEKR